MAVGGYLGQVDQDGHDVVAELLVLEPEAGGEGVGEHARERVDVRLGP